MNIDSYMDTDIHSAMNARILCTALAIPSVAGGTGRFSDMLWGADSHLPIRLLMMSIAIATQAWIAPDGVRIEPITAPEAAKAHGRNPLTDDMSDMAKGYAPDRREPAENMAPVTVYAANFVMLWTFGSVEVCFAVVFISLFFLSFD